MYALILSIALCGVAGGDVQDPVRTNILSTIEMIRSVAGVQTVSGVFAVDNAGHITMFERIPRRMPSRDHTATPGAWPVLPVGVCDSDAECKAKVKKLCKDAKHCGVKEGTVSITTHDNGSKTCSGDCSCNGAIAFVACGKPNSP